MREMQTTPEFQEGTDAPPFPADAFYPLEETKVEIYDTTAAKLANRLISLIETEHAMNILKVSGKKFSIKVESTNPTWFVLKLRIYSKPPLHIVEFQRHRGDTIAFHQFFDRARALLSAQPNSIQAVCDFAQPPQLIQDTGSLQPLVDMATNNCDTRLLAEVASALANAAVKQEYALELCTREAFVAFKCMLHAGGFNILQPAAQLLSVLAMNEEAAPFFAEKTFWQALLDVVIADRTCDKLKTRFASIISSALSFHASEQQVRALEVANETANGSGQVHNIFRETFPIMNLVLP